MRWLMIGVVAACSSITSQPGDDESGSGSGSGSYMKAEICGDARDCRADDAQCETYEYKDLPQYCWEVCHTYCCSYAQGQWRLNSYTCMPDGIDSGIDTDAETADGL
ncbi:MAG TPA: hypothetical protein VIV11_13930 [Kofleriaceae bacterium]